LRNLTIFASVFSENSHGGHGNVIHTLLFGIALDHAGEVIATRCASQNHTRPRMMILAATDVSNRELSGQFLGRRHVLQLHVVG
jgi:hypothetical protein